MYLSLNCYLFRSLTEEQKTDPVKIFVPKISGTIDYSGIASKDKLVSGFTDHWQVLCSELSPTFSHVGYFHWFGIFLKAYILIFITQVVLFVAWFERIKTLFITVCFPDVRVEFIYKPYIQLLLSPFSRMLLQLFYIFHKIYLRK